MIVLYSWIAISFIMFLYFIYGDIKEYYLTKKAYPEIRFRLFMYSRTVTAAIISVLTPYFVLSWCYITLKVKFVKGKENAN